MPLRRSRALFGLEGARRVCLTGISGYLGSRWAWQLLDQGMEVWAPVRRRSRVPQQLLECQNVKIVELSESSLEADLSAFAPEILIHTATLYPSSDTAVSELAQVNIELPKKLIELSHQSLQLLVNCDTSLPSSVNDYALTKREFAETVMGDSRFSVLNLVLEQFYGPWDGRFVSYLFRQIMSGEKSVALTEGDQVRDFIHIEDLLAALSTLGKASIFSADRVEKKRVSVGSGCGVSVRQLVELVHAVCGSPDVFLDFGALPKRENEPDRLVAETSYLRSVGWKCSKSLKEGLTLAWEVTRGGSPMDDQRLVYRQR